jgi:hypothetical protein
MVGLFHGFLEATIQPSTGFRPSVRSTPASQATSRSPAAATLLSMWATE